MAKRVKPGSLFFRVWAGGGQAPKIDAISYDLDDTTDSTITSYQKSGTAPATPADAHELTGAELGDDATAGDVAKLLKDMEDAIKTAEGIA